MGLENSYEALCEENVNLVDVHCHLDFPEYWSKGFKWFKEFINQQEKAGVKAIVSNSSSFESNERVLAISRNFDIVKPALGLHPIHVHELSKEQFESLINLIKSSTPIAIGEVGLDFKEGKASKQEQELVLEEFFKTAISLNIPIILHSRGAEFEISRIVESFNYKKTILHYFNGRKHLVKKLSEQGFYFSIPTNIVKLQQLQIIAEIVDINQLLTETDSPFLSPDKSKPFNEPKNVFVTIKKIAEIKNLSASIVAEKIFENYKRLFL